MVPITKEDELEARFAALVIKDKEIRQNKSNPEVVASHRLVIELDDDFDHEIDYNGTSPVGDLIPTLRNLKINSLPQNRNDKLDVTKKTIKVILRSADAQRFQVDECTQHQDFEVESSSTQTNPQLLDTQFVPVATTPPILNKPADTSKLKGSGLPESSKVTVPAEFRPCSEENSFEEKVTTSKSNVVISAVHVQPGSCGPPREPRAMRDGGIGSNSELSR